MKIIDATWEKRNLGVYTQEVTIEESDSIDEIKKELDSLDSEYRVVKIPTGKLDAMWQLEDMGYKFIETSVHVVHDLKHLELDGLLKRIDDGITYELMDDEDINHMFEEIEQGLFYTDRIALDPMFTVEQAANRYVGWLKDEISRGTEMYKYIYKNQIVGFFAFKRVGEGIYFPFLAGIYKDFQKSPLGMVYLYKPLIEAKKRNAKCVSTYISTNNSNAVRMHVQFGFTFKEMKNVYVKHY